ncbi:large ribosomal subunit protein eL36B [Monosporozyma unispora]|nr:60S ribosomal protein L36B [Kazachstania unispora]
MAAKTGIAVGLNKGKQVTTIAPVAKISYKKGTSSQRTTFVRSLVKEIAGLAPYERRLIDLIRNSGEKRARKVAKKRLGSFKRAKAKIEEMNEVIAASRRH